MSLLTARALIVRYGEHTVLDAVDLDVRPGEVVGLIGPNGAGKTSLLKASAGLVPATFTRLEIVGAPPARGRRRALAREVAYLAQGAGVHWPLAVERVVALGRLPHLGPWQRPARTDREAIARAMSEADVTAFAARPVTELSDGERMRVLIARALAVEPRLLLADEPVTALDPYHQLRVMEWIAGVAAKGGGVLVVLHDLALAARFCHRLVLLNDGHAVAEGAPMAVLSEENLRETYGIAALRGEVDGQGYVLPWRCLAPERPETAP